MKKKAKKNQKSNIELVKRIKGKTSSKKNRSYIGRTYMCSDNDLPHKNQNSNKIVNLAIIEENASKELAGVRLTTQETKNAVPFDNKHRLYKGYKTFLITKFQNGTSIKANDKRIKENPWINNLTKQNIQEIKSRIYKHCVQAPENRKLRDNFKKNDKD